VVAADGRRRTDPDGLEGAAAVADRMRRRCRRCRAPRPDGNVQAEDSVSTRAKHTVENKERIWVLLVWARSQRKITTILSS
jgi:hypothetical protein